MATGDRNIDVGVGGGWELGADGRPDVHCSASRRMVRRYALCAMRYATARCCVEALNPFGYER